MAQEVLSVPEVTCEHCVNALEGAVGALEGVDRVKVDLDRQDITIDYADARGGHASFLTAITRGGNQAGSEPLRDIGYPPMESPPPGFVLRITPHRVAGIGPWVGGHT